MRRGGDRTVSSCRAMYARHRPSRSLWGALATRRFSTASGRPPATPTRQPTSRASPIRSIRVTTGTAVGQAWRYEFENPSTSRVTGTLARLGVVRFAVDEAAAKTVIRQAPRGAFHVPKQAFSPTRRPPYGRACGRRLPGSEQAVRPAYRILPTASVSRLAAQSAKNTSIPATRPAT